MRLKSLIYAGLAWGAIAGFEGNAGAAGPGEIERAVGRGVEFLKASQAAGATWRGGYGTRTGGIALITLALLECGVPDDDPVVAGAVRLLRERARSEVQTYDLTLLIMVFDRLTREESTRSLRSGRVDSGRSRRLKSGRILVDQQVDDSMLIEDLGARLCRGQGERGSWSYQCRSPSDGDHSNTQFAVLGAWIAGQHGGDVRRVLERCDQRFRSLQGSDGGWGYRGGGGSTPSMTCAGLMALAAALGQATELRQSGAARAHEVGPRRDEAVERGMACLAQYLDRFAETGETRRHGLASDLYFLWSLERVGMLYGIARVGTVDWYQWGSDRLLGSQQDDGSWGASYGREIGTAFALLFLSRSNVSPELSRALAGKLDLTTRTMKAFAPGSDSSRVFDDNEAVMLLVELDAAAPERQRAILEALRDGKGAAFTEGLSDAVGRLEGDAKKHARECLVQRMERMTVKTLRDKFAGDDAEVRVAAIHAAARKGAAELMPELIELLKHPDDATWQASRDSLRALSGKDFGPRTNASAIERFEATAAWRKWWQGGKEER
jgi:hypothetical protein